jgi:SOS response regulatory protein OraA/RecX
VKNKKAYSSALKMLSRRGYSEAELREKLSGFASEAETNEIVEECKRFKYLNDKLLADFLVEKYLKKSKGYYYIFSVLEKRKISCDLIAQMKEDFDLEREYSAAKNFFLETLKKKKKKSSIIFSLKSRGFSLPTINRIMHKYLYNSGIYIPN